MEEQDNNVSLEDKNSHHFSNKSAGNAGDTNINLIRKEIVSNSKSISVKKNDNTNDYTPNEDTNSTGNNELVNESMDNNDNININLDNFKIVSDPNTSKIEDLNNVSSFSNGGKNEETVVNISRLDLDKSTIREIGIYNSSNRATEQNLVISNGNNGETLHNDSKDELPKNSGIDPDLKVMEKSFDIKCVFKILFIVVIFLVFSLTIIIYFLL